MADDNSEEPKTEKAEISTEEDIDLDDDLADALADGDEADPDGRDGNQSDRCIEGHDPIARSERPRRTRAFRGGLPTRGFR